MKTVNSNHFRGDPIVAKYNMPDARPTAEQLATLRAHVKRLTGVEFSDPPSWVAQAQGWFKGSGNLAHDNGILRSIIKQFSVEIEGVEKKGDYTQFTLSVRWEYKNGGSDIRPLVALNLSHKGQLLRSHNVN